VRPSCLYAAEDEAREVTKRLIRDAGYEPVSVGGIENARARGLRPRGVRADRLGLRLLRPTRRAVVRPFIDAGERVGFENSVALSDPPDLQPDRVNEPYGMLPRQSADALVDR
jgi:hypothetical protein